MSHEKAENRQEFRTILKTNISTHCFPTNVYAFEEVYNLPLFYTSYSSSNLICKKPLVSAIADISKDIEN